MSKKRNIYTIAEASACLMNAFNQINEKFYNNELEKPIITIKEGAKKHAFGWIEVKKNWKQGEKERHEINISGDYLDRPINEIIATLMHEMVHLYCIMNKIKDTTRANIYHNRKFKEVAENHGLSIEYNEHIGFSITKLQKETEIWVKENIKIVSFKIYKKRKTITESGKEKPKQSTRKYICPSCGLIVRATKDCKIACIECNEKMILES